MFIIEKLWVLGNEGLMLSSQPTITIACYSATMMNTEWYDASGKYTNYERGGTMPDGETNDASMKRKVFENAIRYIDKLNLNECDKSIVGFMILWTAYNSSYNRSNFHGNDQSRFIRYFTDIAERYVVEHKSEIIDGFKSTKIGGREHVENLDYNESRRRRTPEVTFIQDNEREPINLNELASTIYIIRCNLFHGDKDIVDNEGDKELIKWAYELLLNIAKEHYNIYN